MPPTRYRGEHHQPRQTRLLAILEDAKPHHRTLEVFVRRLLQRGEQGWVRFVDDATGLVVLKRPIAPPRSYRNEPPPRST